MPKTDRLRDWYIRMLEKAEARGVVDTVDFLAETYFPKNQPPCQLTDLPQYEADYWPAEAERYATEEVSVRPRNWVVVMRHWVSVTNSGTKRSFNDCIVVHVCLVLQKKTRGEGTTDVDVVHVVRDRVVDLLHGMSKDFLIIRLRPFCYQCRKYVPVLVVDHRAVLYTICLGVDLTLLRPLRCA